MEARVELACRAPTQEIVEKEELKRLLETQREPVHYIGFEISGLLHAGSLLMAGYKINDLKKAGFKTQLFLADWHTVINDKLEGDWERVKKASAYYEEAFEFFCPGVHIVRGSELYHGNDEYWRDVVEFSKHLTLKRATRCLTIMGRSEAEAVQLAQYLYVPMQGVDIKHLKVDVAHAGMDQRKVHMAAREIFPKMKRKKPIALHHAILSSLAPPASSEEYGNKMSKSKPGSAVFIHDSAEEIKQKLQKAYCPEHAEGNPVLDLAKYIVFHEGKAFRVERPQKFGGEILFTSFEEVHKAYAEKKLHAQDLKNAVAEALNQQLEPVRKHFENKKELLQPFLKEE